MLGGVEEDRRRAPEKSVLLEAFRRGFASVSGVLPKRVKLEAERYFDCGQLRFGFVEVTCTAAGSHGWWRSRAKAEGGAHRVRRVGPPRRVCTWPRYCPL